MNVCHMGDEYALTGDNRLVVVVGQASVIGPPVLELRGL